MKLVIPIFNNDKIYYDAQIIKPSGAVLADTKKIADTGDFFSALRIFLIGCVTGVDDIEDKVALKSLIAKMPYKTAEHLALEVIKLYNGTDDGIEGVYYCPRCGNQIISELKESDGLESDTRDFLSNLKIGYYKGVDGIIKTELTEPVRMKNVATGEIFEEINSYAIHIPTLEDGINAYQKYGAKDEVRLQFAMFVQSLVKINSEPIDTRWKNAVGMLFFEGMKDIKNDVGKVVEEINSYGVIPKVDKHCNKCDKDWKATVNTSNFFGSALRPM